MRAAARGYNDLPNISGLLSSREEVTLGTYLIYGEGEDIVLTAKLKCKAAK